MGDPLRTPVAIAGGGPVGLALALFLDRHGIPSTVFGTGEGGRHPPPGGTLTARTMEHYRGLGVSAPIRRLGLPAGHPAGIAYYARFGAPELSRLTLPTATERLRQVAAAARTDQFPEPAHRAGQAYVEDFLAEHARSRPNITLRTGWRITALRQDAERVRLHTEYVGPTDCAGSAGSADPEPSAPSARSARSAPSGRPAPDGRPGQDWTARYAVAGDAAPGFVTHVLGIRYEAADAPAPGEHGEHGFAATTTAHLRLPTFHREVLAGRRAWSYWAVNADLVLNLTALDGADEFQLLTGPVGRVEPGGPGGPDTADDAARITDLVRRAAGTALPVEVLGHRSRPPGPALLADRFVKGRVLLAGDSAHPYAPGGGPGLNTGVEDAANLAWKLAAVLRGWGGPELLATYAAERRPVALRTTAAARELRTALARIDRPAALDDAGPAGAAARDRAGDLLRGLGERTRCAGLDLGVRYDGSPIVAADEDAEPPGECLGMYLPTSVPGGRTPHLWLDDWHGPGSSLFDRLGPGYSLLRLGPEPPSGKPLLAAAQAQGMPLRVLDVEDPSARELYERDLVLIRPDQHVAWRGNHLPTDPGDLVALVTGAGRPLTGRRI